MQCSAGLGSARGSTVVRIVTCGRNEVAALTSLHVRPGSAAELRGVRAVRAGSANIREVCLVTRVEWDSPGIGESPGRMFSTALSSVRISDAEGEAEVPCSHRGGIRCSDRSGVGLLTRSEPAASHLYRDMIL